jgi:predicted DNA-binding transcriptional regulator AlpA
MSLELSDPSFTIDEFCALEKMGRSTLYKLWSKGQGPTYYKAGASVRITGKARRDWQRHLEAAAQAQTAAA